MSLQNSFLEVEKQKKDKGGLFDFKKKKQKKADNDENRTKRPFGYAKVWKQRSSQADDRRLGAYKVLNILKYVVLSRHRTDGRLTNGVNKIC